MLDYRFPTALQMVLSVAMAEQLGERSTSAVLAYGLEANPSFIRKLMVPLTRDGIIVSTLGRNGSIHLGRPADQITLRDIYLSVIEDKKLWASRPDVPARCVISANACWYFKSVADEAEQASLAVLAPVSYTHLDVYKRQCIISRLAETAAKCRRWPDGAGESPRRDVFAPGHHRAGAGLSTRMSRGGPRSRGGTRR